MLDLCILISTAVPASGVTVITVNPGGGADQTSMFDANEALPNPLDDNYEIYCAGSVDDPTPVVFAINMGGHTVRVYGNWSGGVFNDGQYQLAPTTNWADAIKVTSPTTGITFDHLQLKGLINGGYRSGHAILVTTANNVTIHDCLMRDFNQGGGFAGVCFYTTGTAGRLAYNNIISNCDYALMAYMSQGDFYNNTVVSAMTYGLYVAFSGYSNNLIKNNLISSSGVADYKYYFSGPGGTLVTAKNYTSDPCSPDEGCANATITFGGASDYHLDASMIGTLLGVDLSGIFTTDIDGETRNPANFYAGADELPGGGTGGGGSMIANKSGNKQ